MRSISKLSHLAAGLLLTASCLAQGAPDKEKLSWKQEADGLIIQPAKTWPSEHAVVFKIVFVK